MMILFKGFVHPGKKKKTTTKKQELVHNDRATNRYWNSTNILYVSHIIYYANLFNKTTAETHNEG